MSGGYEFKLIGLQGEETTVQQSEGPYSCTYCGMKFTNQEACDNHQCACKRKVEAEEMNMIRSRRNAEPFFELGSHGNRTVGHGVPSIIQEMEPPNDYTQPFLSQLERYLEHCEDLANVPCAIFSVVIPSVFVSFQRMEECEGKEENMNELESSVEAIQEKMPRLRGCKWRLWRPSAEEIQASPTSFSTMKSETWLDSAVFQLTPTRTRHYVVVVVVTSLIFQWKPNTVFFIRCDLVIAANGKSEKIASGLLSPFLAHLKTAQDQIAKGGYSITLKPDPGSDATWFTKGTVERFVSLMMFLSQCDSFTMHCFIHSLLTAELIMWTYHIVPPCWIYHPYRHMGYPDYVGYLAKPRIVNVMTSMVCENLGVATVHARVLMECGHPVDLRPCHGAGSSRGFVVECGLTSPFVRFVSTPEVLERVNTIESEIIQIEEAIVIQSNDDLGLSTVEDRQARSVESIEGGKPVVGADAEKAIVLYKPGAHPPESDGSTTQEENSKVQLLRVLETRKTVLQKEQGMAFARAVAAGFDMDHMAPLISFAECFGASRLMEACLRFMDLWKGKHETGQWLEFEAAEVMSSRSDLSSLNASGIMLSSEAKTQKEFQEAWPESHAELATESNGKTSNDASADKRPPMDPQVPLGHHAYFQGQFQHPMFPQWPIHSPPGAPPVFQAYPIQGMPYYQNYPGNGPFFQPPYPPMEDPRFNAGQRMRQKRHSMDSKDSNTEPEEMGFSSARSQDDLELEREGSQGREPLKKAGRSGKKQSGTVVIRNINYITSKRKNTSGSESESASSIETDEEAGDLRANATKMKHKNSIRSSRSKGSHTRSTDKQNSYDKDDTVNGHEADGGNWQAFQNCLLRDDDEDTRIVDRGMFAMEKEAQVKRRQNTAGGDPIVPHGQNLGELQEGRRIEFDTISGMKTRMLKPSNDEPVIHGGEFHFGDVRGSRNGQAGVQFTEIEGGSRGYRRSGNDDFMIHGRESQSGFTHSPSDPLAGNGFQRSTHSLDRSSSHNVTDESFIVPLRSSSQDQVGADDRTVIDMDSELPSVQKTEDLSSRIRSQLSYEPDDLSLMPERGTEGDSIGYDYAVDYEMEVHAEDAAIVETRNKDVATGVKESSKKSDKDKKSKVMQGSSEKRKMEAAMRKGKPSKLNPLAEAQARAERLRAFKADLQKVKKEKEEEEIKRLEALKRERQKRIAGRGSSSSAQSPLPSHQPRSRLPTKLSPSSHNGSKFSDSEPGSLSPLQRLPIRTGSVGSGDSHKTSKPSRLNNGSRLAGHGLSRSVSSLPELKKENGSITPEPKVATARTRRLSDPKTSNSHPVSSVKLRNANPVSKPKASDGPEIKKISDIMSLDRTKAATLPELKIKTSKGPSDMVPRKSATKEMTQKVNGSKSSAISESAKLNKSNEKISHHNDGDDNSVIDKTVVMLEREKSPVPVIHITEEMKETRKGSYDEDNVGENTDVVSEYATIRVPPSTLAIGEVDRDSSRRQLEEQPSSHQVTTTYEKEELPKFSGISVAEKTYQAPYARVSSLEDPCTKNLEYTKATPTSSGMATSSTEIANAHVSNFADLNSLEPIPEALEKPRGKDSSKGFRRLLKFGRKNHSSAAGERNVESDKLSVDGSVADDNAANAASPNEGNMHLVSLVHS
ncbi:hypothetical protein HHK36_012885 [Tetracentron sinense]|uniref:Uncharacterized protein n=1 Tax=Tetracentron sinense TaxID=13715 RepID=A0A834Z5J6_TETSI|nr:hypothetical protein HHK36_012885 [Tetracentron sinense]